LEDDANIKKYVTMDEMPIQEIEKEYQYSSGEESVFNSFI
jgi:hypothetical protein